MSLFNSNVSSEGTQKNIPALPGIKPETLACMVSILTAGLSATPINNKEYKV